MGVPVAFSPTALRDLDEIARFIAKNGQNAALRFGNRLLDRAEALGGFPEMGRTVRELGNPAIREIVLGSYRIIYEYGAGWKEVHILRFWHASRGVPQLPDEPM